MALLQVERIPRKDLAIASQEIYRVLRECLLKSIRKNLCFCFLEDAVLYLLVRALGQLQQFEGNQTLGLTLICALRIKILKSIPGVKQRIGPDMHPIGLLDRGMAADAFGLIVGGGWLAGVGGIEEGPAPAVAPQAAVLEAALGVLDHHEPARILVPGRDMAGGHIQGMRRQPGWLHRRRSLICFRPFLDIRMAAPAEHA